MRNRKVLFIAHNHPDILSGGAEIFAYNLFKEIEKRKKYQAFYLSSAIEKKIKNGWVVFYAINRRENEMIMCGDDYNDFNHSHYNIDHISVNFEEFIRSYKPDVVHFQHFLRIGLEAISVIKQTLPETKIILTLQEYHLICHRAGQMVRTINNEELCTHASPQRCHNCFPHITEASFRTREVSIKSHLRLVDCFIAPSKFIAQRFIEWGLPPKKIKVLDYGYPKRKIVPHRQIKRGEGRNRFAYFGQITPYKGVLLLLKAAQILLEKGFTDWQLDIFGNLYKKGFYDLDHNFRRQLRIVRSHVLYHGSYQPKDFGRLITPIDWTIVPSTWWENSPLVIQEAFLHRRPVITSNVGGMAEKVRDGVDGLHFKVNDPVSLADIIEQTATNKKLWNKLVSNIKSPMTIDECAQRHEELYDKLLKEN